ncbi:MAG: ABC transporter ATP-binding protein [Coriobacteriales bacterium]|jgi:ABC-2 type transport system ATP-binding protein|nr:ABC transporter ATP-binding protein [Coriobacteriales bacterium]
MALLALEGVHKRFGKVEVLRGIDLAVEQGSVYGFIGKNGSGKTTTMKLVVGLLKADAGALSIKGRPVAFGQTPTNRDVGYLPDVPEFYGFMNALEYLAFCGKVTGMNRTDRERKSAELIGLVGLAGDARRRIRGYSRGMKQRLGIAQALIHSPALLLCDEPTSALDPQGRSEVLSILSAVRERTTVVFSTHILTDVERICDTIGVLNNGVLVLTGSLDELKRSTRSNTICFTLDPDTLPDTLARLAAALQALPFVRAVSGEGAVFRVDVNDAPADTRALASVLVSHDVALHDYRVMAPSLESLYLELIA